MSKYVLFVIVFSSLGLQAAVVGQRTSFQSPNGVFEECVRLTHMPGGIYSAKDIETEAESCAIDVYAQQVAMCPKTWSTSPGTMLYSTEGLPQSQYENSRCAGKSGHAKLAKFKNTMNGATTSSTFSTSSLLYYHFSRYFNSTIDVPVAVYRSFDKDEHYRRVSMRAKGSGRMNPAAWSILRAAEPNPSTYSPVDELFTPDRRQIFGVILKDKGTEYGPEIDGTETGKWGTEQNLQFQDTPGFMALKIEAPLAQAIQTGVAKAIQDPIIKKAMGGAVTSQQIVYWMKDLTEISLLDYIFSQQDRIENVDCVWEWTYNNAGEVKSVKVKDDRFEKLSRLSQSKIPVPTEIAVFKPILLQRTIIGDNDAGGRTGYTNFAKKSQMLEKIRHYSADTYRKLATLARDFAVHGPLYQHVGSTFGLTTKQFAQATDNTAQAFAILKGTCVSGKLRFDLKPKDFFLGLASEEAVDCENP